MEPTTPSNPTSSTTDGTSSTVPGRIAGIDLARCLAIFGMFAVHIGPTDAEGLVGWLYGLPHGRASLLFVLVAGIGVSLLAGSSRGSTIQARTQLVWRAVLLLPLGLALQDLDHGAAVILQDYGALFVVAAVVLSLPDRWLLGVVGLVLPIGSVVFLQGRLAAPEVFDRGVVAISDPAPEIVHGIILSGPYPLITWLAPFLFGLWLGRQDLRSAGVRSVLVLWGLAIAVTSWVASWVLEMLLEVDGELIGWAYLVVDGPHRQMPLWVIGSTAAATALLGAALVLADAFPRATRPLVQTGQLALTVYVGHLLVLHSAPEAATADEIIRAIGILGVFAIVALAFSSLWRRRFRRGPLELLLHLPWRRS